MKPRQLGHWLLSNAVAMLVGLSACLARSEGIPEPSLVMYGVIRNGTGASSVRVTTGTLQWVFQPTGGGNPITIETQLTNINDQFSYVLRVPCETEIAGLGVTANTLKLAPAPTSYNRSKVTVNGAAASFVQPDLANLILTGTDRGRIERVDLQLSAAVIDSDGNGLPDDWEVAHFNRTGVSASADPDKDGMSNLAEFRAGTDPNDAKSLFAFVEVRPDPSGGVLIKWSSVAGKLYKVERSADLLGGFSVIASGVVSTAPVNSYHDPSAMGAGPYFYRLQVQE